MGKKSKTSSNYKQALKTVNIIKNNNLLKLNTYTILPIDERFAKIMRLYDQISNWKLQYKEVEKRKPKDVRTPLIAENIEDIIDGALYDDILEVTLAMHVANRIAHSAIVFKESIIKNFISSKVENNELDSSVMEEKNLERILKRISIVHDSINPEDSMITQLSKTELSTYGITPKMIKELDGKGIEELNKLERSAFYIKDFEIDNAIEILKERDDISYGRLDDNTGRSLVIDLPYYGQFLVHLKTKQSISALSNTSYDEIRVYEKESVLLTDGISEPAEYLIKSRRESGKTTLKELLPELRKIRKDNPRFAHYVALKMGATKKELDELYQDTPCTNNRKQKTSRNSRKKTGLDR